jgi:short/branched chain acyl-CoA dehydrogenase
MKMNFELTKEQQMIKKSAHEFAQKELAPFAGEREESGEWPYDVWEKMRPLGYTGLTTPEEYGGIAAPGTKYMDSILVLEEIARADDTFATSLQVHNLVQDMFFHMANDKQKNEWLPKLASGEVMGAFALTEPNAGSDANGIETRAELIDGEWVINGTKIFISNSGLKNTFGVILMAITGQREDGRKEISSILVPQHTPGYIVGEKFNKIGWHIMDTRELIFKDCRVPEENVFGVRGKGISQALGGLNLGRIDFGAIGTGVAQAAFDHALKYSKERVQFGKPICKNQVIAFMLADMAMNVETARLHAYKAAWLYDEGKPHGTEATIAKLVASEMAHENVMKSFQIHGGNGFMKEYDISRLYRNVKMLEIGEGTNEICRIVISRALGV